MDEDLGAPGLGASCPDCVNKLDYSRSFIEYAVEKLSDKFPFDIIGDYNQVLFSSNSCPSFTTWGKTYQLCQINSFFSAIKYPVVISWLIYLVTHL